MHQLMTSPPCSAVEPVTEILHGVSVTDPYRWLEDQDDPCTRAWIEEQTRYARAYLDNVPRRDRIRERIHEFLAVETYDSLQIAGGRYFFRKRLPNEEQPTITMREGLHREDIPLVKPQSGGESKPASLDIVTASSDGRFLAYGIRQGGEDFQAVEILDVVERRVLSDGLPPGFQRGLVFSAEGDGYFYVHEIVGSSRPYHRAVYWHKFGNSHKEDTELFAVDENPNIRLSVMGSPNGEYVAICISRVSNNRTVDLLIKDVRGAKPLRIVAEGCQGLFAPILLRDRIIFLTSRGAKNGHVVEIDLDKPEPKNWREIVAESEARIQYIAVAKETLLVGYLRNLSNRIELFDFLGQRKGMLPCPVQGTVRLFPSNPDSDIVLYRFSSFLEPPTIFSYEIESGKHTPWTSTRLKFDPESTEVERVNFVSRDGTKVPMFLASRKGRRASGPLPTVLTAYGGFGVSISPQFSAFASFLIEQGCLFAVSNVRGGSEFGEQWHSAAKRHNRQNAIDDFVAGAEWLVDTGACAHNRLAIVGGSNGGLLVGAAMTQRPDLFRAVLCLGPLLDMLRYHRFDRTRYWVNEYGSAEYLDDFQVLAAYSPYHRIKDATNYPALMLISGDADTRCNPLHARKMAARLQAASTSGLPIILDYRCNWGHTPAQPLSQRIEALTDRLAFVCNELRVLAEGE